MAGDVIRSGLQLYKVHSRSVLLIGLLCFVLPILIAGALSTGFLAVTHQQASLEAYQVAQASLLNQSLMAYTQPSPEASAAVEVLTAQVHALQVPLRGYFALSIFLRFIVLVVSLYGSLLLLTCSAQSTRFRSLRVLQKSAGRFWQFVGLSVLLGILGGLAFIPSVVAIALFVSVLSSVWGVLLLLIALVVSGYCVLPLVLAPFSFAQQKLGIRASLGYAWKHAQGHRWYLFGVLVLLFVVTLIVSLPFVALFPPALLLVQAFVFTPLSLFFLARVVHSLR